MKKGADRSRTGAASLTTCRSRIDLRRILPMGKQRRRCRKRSRSSSFAGRTRSRQRLFDSRRGASLLVECRPRSRLSSGGLTRIALALICRGSRKKEKCKSQLNTDLPKSAAGELTWLQAPVDFHCALPTSESVLYPVRACINGREQRTHREATIAVDRQRDHAVVIRDDGLRKEDAEAAADKDGCDHSSSTRTSVAG